MSDPLTDAINANAVQPQSMASDGQSASAHTLTDQIAAKKFLDANSAVSNFATGGSFFGRLTMVPPSARGGTDVDIDC